MVGGFGRDKQGFPKGSSWLKILKTNQGVILSDTKYSALTFTTAAGGDIFAVAKLGTSFALTVSSAINNWVTSGTADQGIL